MMMDGDEFLLDAVGDGTPAIRSLFEVFVHENLAIYLKVPCSTRDFRDRFFLGITPFHAKDFFDDLRQFGFNVYDFYSFDQGVGSSVFEGGCLVVRTLPAYEIKRIYTGQSVREESPDGEFFWRGPVWEGSYTFGTTYLAAGSWGKDCPPAPENERADHPGAALFTTHCAGCHSPAAEHSAGPHLNGVIGRRAGSVADFNATEALRGLDIV